MDGVRGTERFETVIVGGGQAGLAVGYHLAMRGRQFVILDASERTGDSWRKRWDSLRLFTPARYDGLPGWPFQASGWSFPTKDDMAAYVEAYATRFHLPVRTGVNVDRLSTGLSKDGGRFVAAAGDQRYEADHVVVATGGFQSARVPAFAPELDPGLVQLHSSQYRRPSQLREGAVLVVGAGNSGADIALELSRTHRTWLSGRHPGSEPVRPGSVWDRLLTPPFWFAVSRVLTVRTSAGRKLRSTLLSGGHPLARVKPKDLAAAGVERVPRTVGVRGGLPVVEDGRVMDVSNVIWCTGFRREFGWIDLPVFGEDGLPVHDRGVVGAEPGLYFVGLPFLSALTSSLVGGVGRDAEHIAKHITEHIASRKPSGQPRAVARATLGSA
jgi:putative flavoprotein involved in K+ transport